MSMKKKINAFFHVAGGLECEEKSCPFKDTCANHETLGEFWSEGRRITPEIILEGEDIYCKTVLRKSSDNIHEFLPENYGSLNRGMICKEPDGSLTVDDGTFEGRHPYKPVVEEEEKKYPQWTVLYNIVSKESNSWVGTGWEFFDKEEDAENCYNRHVASFNCPTKRPFYRKVDEPHLGAAHRM